MRYPWNYTRTKACNSRVNFFRRFVSYWEYIRLARPLFRPQSDWQSQRNIRTLLKMIAMITNKQEVWDEHLPFISIAYRSTQNESTGFTPNFMMYGHELSMPVNVMLSLPPEEKYTTAVCAKFAKTDPVSRCIMLCQQVWRKGVMPKFQPNWKGPCPITKMHYEVLA